MTATWIYSFQWEVIPRPELAVYISDVHPGMPKLDTRTTRDLAAALRWFP